MKKIIAPLIITVLTVAYFAAYFGFIISVIDLMIIKILLGIIPAALAGTMIYVCVERIKEIRSGEEDDLSKY
ncbi:MAG: hypothetical protein PUB20_05815 [Clostridia bacterium]|nr:hypothetical protein [Clostridia bacterium]